MEYTVNLLDVLKSLLSTTPILLIIFFVILVPFFWGLSRKLSGKPVPNLVIIFHTFLSAVIVLELLFLTLNISGSGWILRENTLEIKVFPGGKSIDLFASKIALVDANEWQPIRKRKGVDSQKLDAGIFYLQNGSAAVNFRHLNSPTSLVIFYDRQYYIINHPGIEQLYDKLVKDQIPILNPIVPPPPS